LAHRVISRQQSISVAFDKARDTAFYRAEERLGLLAEMFAQLEAEVARLKSSFKSTNSMPSCNASAGYAPSPMRQ
jgi:hypothetical protein